MKNMKRRVLALLLTLAMLSSLMITGSLAASEDAAGTTSIGTEAELRAFADKVAKGESAAKAKLTTDITLTADWTPIGTYADPFSGSFDGQGHSISGLHINDDITYAGLFGYVSGVTIQNLVVKGYVRSTAKTGSAAAVVAHAKGNNSFTNVGAEAIVVSDNTNAGYFGAGGILGFVDTNSSASFTGCYNKGAIVTKSAYAGGIVGGSNSYYVNTDAGINASITLTDCYNLGSVNKTAFGGYVGGIIGYSYDAVLTNCYNKGTITSGYGELAGNKTTAVGTNCYTSADSITAKALGSSYKDGIGTTAPALTWEKAAYAAPATLQKIEVTTVPTKTSYTTAEKFDPAGMVVMATYSDGSTKVVTDYTYTPTESLQVGDKVTISYNDYRTVTEAVTTQLDIAVTQTTHTVRFLCDAGVYVQIGSGGKGYEIVKDDNGRTTSVIVNDGYSLLFYAKAENGYEVKGASGTGVTALGNQGYKISSVTSDVTVTVTAKSADSEFPGDGKGTAEEPYLIQSEADLHTLAEKVNAGTTYFGKYFRLTQDIALTGDWTPIGMGAYYSTKTAFQGSFDGGQHTISGLCVSGAADTQGYGLFGVVSGATIKNLAVKGSVSNLGDSTSGCKSAFGGIVGAANGGLTLENCASHVDVSNQFYWQQSSGSPESFAGGLLGYNYNGDLKITGCYSDGSITNKNTSDYYQKSTKTYAGGLVGGIYNNSNSAAFQNSFASGSVDCSDVSYAGPILGKNNESANPKATATNCFYRSGMAGAAIDSTGASDKDAKGMAALAETLNGGASDLFVDSKLGYPSFSWENGSQPTPGVTPDTSWYKDGESSFTLSTEAQLLGLAQLVNNGNSFAEKTLILGADVAMTAKWTPIGTSSAPFSGSFLGGGHSITGLQVAQENTHDGNGLFGHLQNALVEKLTISGTITGGNNTGAIAGWSVDSTIQYCGSTAAVTGRGYVGGIVGRSSGSSILDCFNRGDVTNTKTTDVYTGGIVGNLAGESSVISSYNTGAVNGASGTDAYTYTGGIAGMSANGAIINSYNVGKITGHGTYTGGVLGSGNLYYQQSGFNFYLTGTAAAGAGASADSTDYITSVTEADLKNAASAAVVDLGADYSAPKADTNGGYPALKWESDPGYIRGYITEIGSRAQLFAFANNVKAGYSYAGKTVKLTANIDLGNALWTAIGDAAKTDAIFAGTFDGQGYSISGLCIRNDNSGALGLFSVLPQGAVVKNVTVSGTIESAGDDSENSCVGGIVGWNRGTVENCVSAVSLNVKGYYAVGGIVGDNSGTVTGCGNTGTVNGNNSSRVGGVVGRSEPADGTNAPMVKTNYNTGAVAGSKYVGGVVGAMFNEYDETITALTLSDCYNTGAVTGTDKVGGIIGQASLSELTLSNCYNAGLVTGGTDTGAIAGRSSAVIRNSYYQLGGVGETLQPVGSGLGENYARPVSADYMKTVDFAAMLGAMYQATEGGTPALAAKK